MTWSDTWQRAAARVDDQPVQWNAELTPAELIECLLFALSEHLEIDDILATIAQEYRLQELIVIQEVGRLIDDKTIYGTEVARTTIQKAKLLGEIVRVLDNSATAISQVTT